MIYLEGKKILTMFVLQTIPRKVLYDNKTGTNILQWPVEEIESLRLRSTDFTEIVVGPGSVVPLDIGQATQVCSPPV
jgi:beta-fructofuranosidase